MPHETLVTNDVEVCKMLTSSRILASSPYDNNANDNDDDDNQQQNTEDNNLSLIHI